MEGELVQKRAHQTPLKKFQPPPPPLPRFALTRMAPAWEADEWKRFAQEHELWRVLLPSLQPELRKQYFETLLPLYIHLCKPPDNDDDATAGYLKRAVVSLLSNGPPEHQTALFFLSLALFPAVAKHALLVEGVAIQEWIDKVIPACIDRWMSADNGVQLSLFVAQCIVGYQQAIAKNQLRAKRCLVHDNLIAA